MTRQPSLQSGTGAERLRVRGGGDEEVLLRGASR